MYGYICHVSSVSQNRYCWWLSCWHLIPEWWEEFDGKWCHLLLLCLSCGCISHIYFFYSVLKKEVLYIVFSFSCTVLKCMALIVFASLMQQDPSISAIFWLGNASLRLEQVTASPWKTNAVAVVIVVVAVVLWRSRLMPPELQARLQKHWKILLHFFMMKSGMKSILAIGMV